MLVFQHRTFAVQSLLLIYAALHVNVIVPWRVLICSGVHATRPSVDRQKMTSERRVSEAGTDLRLRGMRDATERCSDVFTASDSAFDGSMTFVYVVRVTYHRLVLFPLNR